MSSGTPIRPVAQGVAAPSPDWAPNPFHAEPLENNAGPALEGVGNDLMGVWDQMQRQRNALAVADGVNRFQARIGEAKNNLLNSGQSPEAMSQTFATVGKEAVNQISGDPAYNGAVQRQLAAELRLQLAPHLESFPTEATFRAHQDLDFRSQQQIGQAIAQTAGEFQAGRDANNMPVFSTTAAGQEAHANAYKQIASMYPPDARPAEYATSITRYEQGLTLAQGQRVALNAPDLIEPYIARANASKYPLTSDQVVELRNQAISSTEYQHQIVTANHEATQAKVISGLDQMQHENDPRLAGSAYKARAAGWIDDNQFHNYQPGVKYVETAPGNAALVKAYADKLTENPYAFSSEDIAAIPSDSITPDQRRQLQAMRSDGVTAIRKPVGAAYAQGRQAIRDALTPTIPGGENFPGVKRRVEDALSDYDSLYKAGSFQSVGDAQDARDNIIKNVRAEHASRNNPHVAPAIPAPGPTFANMSSRDKLKALGVAARAAGYVPTSSPGAE